MSSQAEGIPLHHAPDDVGYRLIELPPEVQSLLESEHAPAFVPPCLSLLNRCQGFSSILTAYIPSLYRLTLESSDSCALLKTPDRTYSLRQKNTSNAIILLSPIVSATSPEPGLAAISTIKETVELEFVPEPPISTGQLNTGSQGKWHERFGKNR